MSGTEAVVLSLVLGFSQLLGLVTALTTRLSEGSKYQGLFQFFFLAYLALMGAATMVALAIAPGAWLGFGATCSLMVVTAITDFRRPQRIYG